MTVMIIKLLFVSILLASSLSARTYKSINEIIQEQTGKKVEKKKRKVVVGKKGELIVSWGILAEYDPTKKVYSSNIKKIINKEVSINGFMIPLDFSKKYVKEFLLVPYIPTCFHVPPPSKNNIIKVNVGGKSKIEVSYAPFRVIGKLSITEVKKASKDPYTLEGIYEIDSKSIILEKQ